jgi:hypothetical protein
MAHSEIETAYGMSTTILYSISLNIGPIHLGANEGVDEIVEDLRPYALKWGVSYGDMYIGYVCSHNRLSTPILSGSNLRPPPVWRSVQALPNLNSWPVVRTPPPPPSTAWSPNPRTASPISSFAWRTLVSLSLIWWPYWLAIALRLVIMSTHPSLVRLLTLRLVCSTGSSSWR